MACVLCVPKYSGVNHRGDVLQVHPPRDKCPERSPWGLHLKANIPRAVVVSLGVQCVPRELPSGCTLGRYLGRGLRGRSPEGIYASNKSSLDQSLMCTSDTGHWMHLGVVLWHDPRVGVRGGTPGDICTPSRKARAARVIPGVVSVD